MAATPVTGTLTKKLTNSPYNSDLFTFGSDDNPTFNEIIERLNKCGSRLNREYEGFLNDIFKLCNSLKNRQFDSEIRNPDFNLLGTNGVTPITQVDGSAAEFSDKWKVFTGGGTNAYTLTPTPYTSVGFSPTGSNNFINMEVTAQDSELYLYNQNYSTTGQFNSVGSYSGKNVTFSTILHNNNNNNATLNFSAFINDVTGLASNLINSQTITLQPGFNLAATTVQIPELMGLTLGANPYIEFRLNVVGLNGDPLDPTMDLDILYLKAELSNYASFLGINHILEMLICNNLT